MISNTVLNKILNMVLNTVLNTVLDMVSNTVFNMSLNMVLDRVLNTVLNVVLNMNSSLKTNLISTKQSLASVSILPVFSRLILDFSLMSSFFRVNVSSSNKISEYSKSEMESSDNETTDSVNR